MTLDDCIAVADHQEGLDILYNHVLEVARVVPASIPFVEIGTRAGGSALLTLLAIKESGFVRPFFTVDPYGDKPFWRGDIYCPLDYGENHYLPAMIKLATYCAQEGLFHIHWRLLSRDFMKILDQVELWYKGKTVNTSQVGYVFLDGDHKDESIAKELEFFLPRLVPGGLIVIDDAEYVFNSPVPIVKDFVGKSTLTNGRLFYRG